MTEQTADRRAQLQAELARIEQQEREQQEAARKQQQAELDAKLDPEMRQRKTAIEQRAREQLDREWPPAWTPQKPAENHPQELVGLVLRIDPRVGPSKTFGTYSAVIELRATDGKEWTIWANEGGAMYAQLVRLRIQPGEVIGVRYRGKKESESNPGQSYHDFRLVRVDEDDQPAQPVDYDALTRDREPAALPEGEAAPAADDGIPF